MSFVDSKNNLKINKLVVIFSTSWRNWEKTAHNQVAFIKEISDNAVLGIHYWKYSTLSSTPIDPDVKDTTPIHEVPTDIPLQLRRFQYKHSITPNITMDNITPKKASLLYKIISSRIAFQNALDIYEDMPDEQPILWMRPDLFIDDIYDFPKKVGKNEFIGTWHTAHAASLEKPEISDLLAFTTKYVLKKILELDLNYILKLVEANDFTEQCLYTILEHLGVNIKYDFNIKPCLMRDKFIHIYCKDIKPKLDVKVCAYNGCPYHHEMIWHILDFNPEITIFTTFDNSGWVDFYKKLFPSSTILDSTSFNENDWDHIFLLTDDDTSYNIKNNTKIICIDHSAYIRRPHIQRRLSIRHYPNRPNDTWIIPNFKIIFNKPILPDIHIACIGGWTTTKEFGIRFLNIFGNNHEIQFHIFNKDIRLHCGHPNVHIYFNADAETMMNCLLSCDYVLMANPKSQLFATSGCISLAYSTGCRLIVPNGWKDLYKLKSPMEVDYFGTETIEIKKPTQEELENVHRESSQFIKARNNLYTNFLNCSFVLKQETWFHHILGNDCPRTIVETGTYMGDGVRSYIDNFYDIYSIELSEHYFKLNFENFRHHQNVHILQGDSAVVLQTLELPKEPVLFYLDAHFSGGNTAGSEINGGCPVLREIEVISKRNISGDVIIVDDMRLMGQASWGGVEGCQIYPKTFYDFSHVSQANIINALSGRLIKMYALASEIDRLIIIFH
jgi:hypothetical protein